MVEGRESKALGCLQKIANLGGGEVFVLIHLVEEALEGKYMLFQASFVVLVVD